MLMLLLLWLLVMVKRVVKRMRVRSEKVMRMLRVMMLVMTMDVELMMGADHWHHWHCAALKRHVVRTLCV